MLKSMVRTLVRRLGVDTTRYKNPDFDPRALALIRAVNPYTMTSAERVFALIQAVEYVVRAGIPGSIVECGVWRGGSMMAVAKTLIELDATDRDLYLFDTFEGMTRPGELDVSYEGEPASAWFERLKRGQDGSNWCLATLEEVQRNMLSTGYPADRVKLIRGKVEDTIPGRAPESLSILRLDTDWYESTYPELVHLYPRLSAGGVLLIDDYGHWQGQRRAVDGYFAGHPILLNRVDYSGRVAVKVQRA
jgi:hypothetical protein